MAISNVGLTQTGIQHPLGCKSETKWCFVTTKFRYATLWTPILAVLRKSYSLPSDKSKKFVIVGQTASLSPWSGQTSSLSYGLLMFQSCISTLATDLQSVADIKAICNLADCKFVKYPLWIANPQRA